MTKWIFILVMTVSNQILAAALANESQPIVFDKNHPPVRYGVGSHSCGKYLDASVDLSQASLYESYLSGWATLKGIELGANFFYVTDAEGMKHWLRNYCSVHPTDPYADAVFGLIDEMVNRYLKVQR